MILAANVMSRSQNEGFKVTEKRGARWLGIYSAWLHSPPVSGVSVSHVTTCPVATGEHRGMNGPRLWTGAMWLVTTGKYCDNQGQSKRGSLQLDYNLAWS